MKPKTIEEALNIVEQSVLEDDDAVTHAIEHAFWRGFAQGVVAGMVVGWVIVIVSGIVWMA